MTDLSAKFATLQEQLAAQHTELMAKLDTLINVANVSSGRLAVINNTLISQLNALNTKSTTINDNMVTGFNNAFDLTDTMNNNASLNAQLVIATLLQTACPCDTTALLLPPPLTTVPPDLTEEEKCKRVQYFVDLFGSWVINVGQYIFRTNSISSFQIDSLFSSAIADVGITTGELALPMPTGVRDTLVSQLTDAIRTYGAPAVNSALFSMASTASRVTYRDALFSANTAAAGKSAFDTAVTGMALAWPGNTIKDMFYSAWPNDIYNVIPDVDTSAYDGTLCSEPEVTGCYNVTFIYTHHDYGWRWDIHLSASLVGYTIAAVLPFEVIRLYGDPSTVIITDLPYMLTIADINATTGDFFLSSELMGGDIEVCPPGM